MAYFSALKLEAIFSSEISGFFHTTWHYTPEYHTLHSLLPRTAVVTHFLSQLEPSPSRTSETESVGLRETYCFMWGMFLWNVEYCRCCLWSQTRHSPYPWRFILFPYSAVKTSSVSPPPQTRWITGEWKSWSREKFNPSFLKTTPFLFFPFSFILSIIISVTLWYWRVDSRIGKGWRDPSVILHRYQKQRGYCTLPLLFIVETYPSPRSWSILSHTKTLIFFFESAYIEYNTIEFNRVFVCALQSSLLAFPNLHPPSGPELSNP